MHRERFQKEPSYDDYLNFSLKSDLFTLRSSCSSLWSALGASSRSRIIHSINRAGSDNIKLSISIVSLVIDEDINLQGGNPKFRLKTCNRSVEKFELSLEMLFSLDLGGSVLFRQVILLEHCGHSAVSEFDETSIVLEPNFARKIFV